VAVGYSNGANIAASALLLRPETMALAILFRPMVPIVPASMPNLSGKSVFIAGGRRDPIANPSETHRLVDILSQADAAVEMYWHDGGHELGHDDLVAAQNWIKARITGF